MDHQSGDNPDGESARERWERRKQKRRERLRDQFEDSRRGRHDPPPDPGDWEPEPTWKHVLKTMWDNPMTLVLLAIMIAVVLYILFPPEVTGLLPFV